MCPNCNREDEYLSSEGAYPGIGAHERLYNKSMGQRGSSKTARPPAVLAAGAGQSRIDESQHSAQSPVSPAGGPSESHPEQDEIAMVRRATEVLGIDHVARWMRSRIPSLGNQTPYTLIKTEDGRSQIERALHKIEHGVY